MNLLFLCKRRPMNRDLIMRPYGRFSHLPHLMATRGHRVTMALLGYKPGDTCTVHRNGETWHCESLLPAGPFGYLRRLQRIITRTDPDWLIGVSDTYYGILAQRLGKKYRIRSCIDAYDNFESYLPWLKPLHHLWRRALASATLVTAAGPHLARRLAADRGGRNVAVVPMAADQPVFRPLDRRRCRQALGLPLHRKLVGYCGSLYRNRGIDTLFAAFDLLCRERPDCRLILSGRKERGVALPDHVRWVGYLPDDQVPLLLNSMDVLQVVNKPSAFGSYSYPVKLYEAMACNIPVVATSTPPARWILSGRDEHLARPEDPHDLVAKTRRLLDRPQCSYSLPGSWKISANLFEEALLRVG